MSQCAVQLSSIQASEYILAMARSVVHSSDMITMLLGHRIWSEHFMLIEPSKCSLAIATALARMDRLTNESISGFILSICPCIQSTDPIPVTLGGTMSNCSGTIKTKTKINNWDRDKKGGWGSRSKTTCQCHSIFTV